MNFKPLGEYVLVKPAPKETPLGLILQLSDDGTRPDQGTVEAVGPGRFNDKGTLIPNSVKVGDYVMFHEGAADSITVEGISYLLLRDSNIIGIIIK